MTLDDHVRANVFRLDSKKFTPFINSCNQFDFAVLRGSQTGGGQATSEQIKDFISANISVVCAGAVLTPAPISDLILSHYEKHSFLPRGCLCADATQQS
jgi:hypothetical protein